MEDAAKRLSPVSHTHIMGGATPERLASGKVAHNSSFE